jgi:hypothetical protein
MGITLAPTAVSVQHLPNCLPSKAIPALKLELRPKSIVRCTDVDLDARDHLGQDQIPQVPGLFDDIRARQVVSALLHQFLEDHALAIADEIIGVCAAPAIFPFLSTVIKMTSSAISPRDVLIGRADGFIKPSSDLPTKPLVRPLRIRRNIGTSACRNGSSLRRDARQIRQPSQQLDLHSTRSRVLAMTPTRANRAPKFRRFSPRADARVSTASVPDSAQAPACEINFVFKYASIASVPPSDP